MRDFGKLASFLIWFGCISFIIGSFTQQVGLPLGAVLTVCLIASLSGIAIRDGYRWSRWAFILFFPVALWLLTAADLGSLTEFIFFVGLLAYLYGLVLVVVGRRSATLLKSPDGPGTVGALFSFGLLVVSTFLLGWGWTNLSSAIDLWQRGDSQGIAVALLFVGISMIVGAVSLGVWWRHRWRVVAGSVILLTGIALGIHAAYYSAISAMALSDKVLASITRGTVEPVILGRIVFAGIALVVGRALVRRTKVFVRDPDRILTPSQIREVLTSNYGGEPDAIIFVCAPSAEPITPVDMMLVPFIQAEFSRDTKLGMVYGTGSGCALIRKTALESVQAVERRGSKNIESCRDFMEVLRQHGFSVKQDPTLSLDLLP